MLKTIKNKKRQQQQNGKPVLVTFYYLLARPIRDGGAAATASAHDVRNHHHHHHRHHLHLHGGGHEARRGSKPKDGRSYNRRADLLEYSRQLRALARQTTVAAATGPPPPVPHRGDTDMMQLGAQVGAGAVRGDDGQPAADPDSRLSLAGRRARSQQQIRQRCFGNGGWSWKRLLVLVFPFHNNGHSVLGRSKSKRSTGRRDEDSEKNRNSNQKGWPAALLVGKLTVSKSSDDHSGLTKRLRSVFRQRSRYSR